MPTQKNIFTAIKGLFSNSKPAEFTTRRSIEQALAAVNSPNAAKPMLEPTVLADKGLSKGAILQDDHGAGESYHKYMQRESMRHMRYNVYERMDSDLVASALDVYANEATQKNADGTIVGVYSESKFIEDELSDMLQVIGINNQKSWMIIRNMCKYGDHFASVKLDSVKGVVGLKDLEPLSIYRLEQEGELVGYVQDTEVLRTAVQNANVTSAGMNPYINLNTLSLSYMTGDTVSWAEDEEALIMFLKYELAHFRLRSTGKFIPYGQCLKYNTRVQTEYGVKEIRHITKGDKVWSLDASGNKVLSNVLDVMCSGKKPVYSISTRYTNLVASEEHRILTVDSVGAFTYKTPKELGIGDLLVLDNQYTNEKVITIDKSKPSSNKNGYWNNVDLIPDNVTPELARLFGFLLGDGWLTSNSVCFAAGIHQSINEKYISLLEKFTGRVVQLIAAPNSTLPYSQVICGSKLLVTILHRLGFAGNCVSKRIPSWVFQATKDIREAFLMGLVDADGSLFIDAWDCLRFQLELANEELINDAKALVQSLNYKSGKIMHRQRQAGRMIKGQITKSSLPTWYFYFYASEITQAKCHDARLSNKYILSPVTSIELEESSEETWDIYVDSDSHNFYANGIVVHNSILENAVDVWKKLDLLFDSLIIYRLNRAPSRFVFYVDVGNAQGADVENIVKRQLNKINKKEYIGPNGQLNERYQLLDMNANIYIPMQKESKSKVDLLQGAQNVGEIEDVSFLNNRLFSALKVPKAFLGFEGDVSSKGMLSQQNVTFGKSIQNLQEDFLETIKDICIIHLAIRGISTLDDLKSFDLVMSRPSYIEEKAKVEIEASKVSLASSLDGFGVNKKWIAKHILGRTDSEVEAMFRFDPTMPNPNSAPGLGGGMPLPGGDLGMAPGLDMGMGGMTPAGPEMGAQEAMPAAPMAPAEVPLQQHTTHEGDLLVENHQVRLRVSQSKRLVKSLSEQIRRNGLSAYDVVTRKNETTSEPTKLTEPTVIFE